MSKFLRDLLDAKEPLFSLSLQQLEKSSGSHGVDAHLVGDIYEKANVAIKKLGLDHTDVTGKELYHALVAKIAEHDKHLAKSIGGHDAEDVQSLIPLMKKAVDNVKIEKGCWVLKKSVAKEMLRKTPPPKIMEHLGYRSVDSMLKHENLAEIYGALRFAEGPEWLNEFNEMYKSLKPSDFESRDIEIVIMPHDRWADLCEGFVHKKRHNITHLKELGVILMLPVKLTKMPGITISAMPLLFHYLNEIRLYSAFFKLQQVHHNFGEIIVETLLADPGSAAVMAGHNVHWRVIQRYFGKLENEYHPEIFEPHVQPEDLHWRKAEESLYLIDPELEFWKDMDYVALLHDGRPTVFNMMDVSFSYVNNTPYENRVIFHFRESLWNEIFIRYMGQKSLEDQILKQLDNDLIAPERLHPAKLSPAEKADKKKRQSHILMRQKMIDAAEGRLVGVSHEFTKAFDILQKYEKTVTIFGSARLPEESDAYKHAYTLAARLAGKGYAIVTGGGLSVMEAANRGAHDSGGDSIGFNINLPTEQKLNAYTTESLEFEHFFGRKVAMTMQTSAYMYLPGGFGTMDELFEIVTLQQTGKIPRVPIILIGKDFWQPLLDVISKVLDKKYHTIHPADMKLLYVTDDLDEAIERVVSHQGDEHKQPEGAKPHARSK